MTAQPNQGFIFAAPAAIQIRRRPCALSMSQLTRSPSFGPAAGTSPRPHRSDTDGETRADRDVDRQAQRLRRERGQGHEDKELIWLMHWFG